MTCVIEIDIQKHPHVIILLGSGLIGGAIANELAQRFDSNTSSVTVHWGKNPSRSFQELYQKTLEVITTIRNGVDKLPIVHVVWAAGLSGFSSSEKETQEEFDNFYKYLSLSSKLAATELDSPLNFHLISSAGGLFEGQRLISRSSDPSPIRPYGYLKLAQENLLSESNDNITGHIYRLSSVYGFIRPQQRRGLISALVENARYGQVTVISGSMYTLRDFVWAPDVARFIVRTIELGETLSGPVILASGKPESVENVKRYIESSLKRKVYSRYLYTPTNGASTCISSSALPRGWVPSYIKSNIDRILSTYRSFDVRPT
jgi:UDP-glucose 4-epimerase